MMQWKNRRIAVTGGAGFIGSNLVARLLDEGSNVSVIDDFSSGYRRNLDFISEKGQFDYFRLVEGDIRDMKAVEEALSGCDTVFHMAALGSVPASVDRPEQANDINIGGSLNVMRAAKRLGLSRVVVSSSAAVYGNDPELPKVESQRPQPESPYATSKIAMEYYAANFTELYDLPCAILRYFNVFGEKQDPASQYAAVIPIFVSKLLDGESPIIYGDGEQTRDFIHVQDVVSANMLAATAPPESCGRPINVAGGVSVSVNELFRQIKALLGSDKEAIHLDAREGDIRHSLAAVEQAASLLEFRRSIDLKDGLAQSIEWYKQDAIHRRQSR